MFKPVLADLTVWDTEILIEIAEPMQELVDKNMLSHESVIGLKDKVIEIFRHYTNQDVTSQWAKTFAALLKYLPEEILRGQIRDIGITHSCLSSSLQFRILSAHCTGSLFKLLH